MNWRKTTYALALLILAAASATARGQSEQGDSWVIKGATLIDGTGVPPIRESVIVGQGEKIVCAGVATSCRIPESATIIDAGGKFVIPGLIDTHVHVRLTGRAADQLTRFAFGITTTRDAGTPETLQVNLKRRGQSDLPTAPEPRLVVSALVSDENMKAYGASDFADLVRKLAQSGVDAIKIKQEFSEEELTVITKEAHANRLPVFGHTWSSKKSSLTAALAAGVDGLSHMTTFSMYGQREDAAMPPQPGGIDAFVWESERWNYQDDGRLDIVIQSTVGQSTWIEPMLAVERHFTLRYPFPEGLAYLGEAPSVRQTVRPWIPYGDWGWPAVRSRRGKIDAAYRHMCDFVSRFHARGGVVLTGTDDLAPGPGLIEEIELLAGCGFSSMEALQSATKHAAAALKQADRGTIEAGKTADLVILNEDPLQLPANLLQVWRVVKGGHLHDPAVLLSPMVSDYRAQARKVRIELAVIFSGVILFAVMSVVAYRRFRHRKGLASLSS